MNQRLERYDEYIEVVQRGIVVGKEGTKMTEEQKKVLAIAKELVNEESLRDAMNAIDAGMGKVIEMEKGVISPYLLMQV